MTLTPRERLARAYLLLGLLGGLLSSLMAALMRWQLARPGVAVPLVGSMLFPGNHGAMPARLYPSALTLHGTGMIWFAVSPALLGGVSLLALSPREATDPIAPSWRAKAGFAATLLGALVMLASCFAPLGPPAAGWTAYPPLSTGPTLAGAGQTLWCVAVALAALGVLFGALDALGLVAERRQRGLRWRELSQSEWGFFFASALNVLFVPVLLAALAMLLSDRVLGTSLFAPSPSDPRASGDPAVYLHLFWIFGHPEVYILALPVWGIISDALGRSAGGRLYARGLAVGAMGAVTVLSTVVYGHHLATAGLGPLLTRAFMALTVAISMPSALLVVHWIGTVHRGITRPDVSTGYALGALWVFVLGGCTGLPLAAVTTDVFLHDTHYVVGHFHLVMGAMIVLGLWAAVLPRLPRLTGRELRPWVAKAHLAVTLVGLHALTASMIASGLRGMPRRIADPRAYELLRATGPWSTLALVAAVALPLSMALAPLGLRRVSAEGDVP